MGKKEKELLCVICGKRIGFVYNIGFELIRICPRCAWTITLQTIDHTRGYAPRLEEFSAEHKMDVSELLDKMLYK